MERDEQHPEMANEGDHAQADAATSPRAGIVADLCQDIAAGHPLICVCDAGRARTQALETLAAGHGELGHMVHVAAPHAGALLDDLVHVLSPNAPELDARMARRELAVQLTRIAQTARPIALVDDAHTLLPEDIDLLLHFFPGRRATLVLAGSGNPAIWFTGSGPGVAAFEAAVVYELGSEREDGGGHAEPVEDDETRGEVPGPGTLSGDATDPPWDARAALPADEPDAVRLDGDADNTVPDERGVAVPPWSMPAELPAGDVRQPGADPGQGGSGRGFTARDANAGEVSVAGTSAVTEPAAVAHTGRVSPAPSSGPSSGPPGEPDAAPGAAAAAAQAAAPARPEAGAESGARDASRASPRTESAVAPAADSGPFKNSKYSHQGVPPGLGTARAAAAPGPADATGIARRNRYLALAAIAVIAVVTLLSRWPDERADEAPTPVRTPAEATPRVAVPPRLTPPVESARGPGPRAVAGAAERGGATHESPTAPPATAPARPTSASAESAAAAPPDDAAVIALPPVTPPPARETAARGSEPAPSVVPDAAEKSPARPPAPTASVAPAEEERLPVRAAPPTRTVVEAPQPATRAAPAAPAVDREEVARMYAERAAYEWDQGRLDAAAVSIARGLESDPLNRRLRDLQVMLRSARDADAAP